MHRGMLHRLLAVALVLFCALPAFGQFTRDKAANKKIDEAINTHYFATDFDKAEGVLLGTIEACGNKCSPQTLARAWMYVGIVRGSGKKDTAGAKEAFSTALTLDQNVKLDTDLASADTKAAFAEVGGSGGGASVPPPAGGGEDIGGEPVGGEDIPGIGAGGEVPGAMICTPDVREVQTLRPIPISCSSEEAPATVEVRYKPFGEESWKKVALVKRGGDLWQAEIPCDASADAGALRWYVQARSETGDVIDNYGTEEQPVVMTLSEDSAAEPPSFPGQSAPPRCSGMAAEGEICPPDFPGCESGEKQCGDKDWGAACGNSTECKCGLLCVEGACETAPVCESDADCPVGTCISGTCGVSQEDASEGASGPYKKLWVGIHAAYDLGTIGGDEVCYSGTQAAGTFACFEGSDPYPNPERSAVDGSGLGEEPHPGTNIAAGFATGTARLLLSGDYALSPSFTLGARAGYALLGNPGDFMPIHAEARATYHILDLSRPFGFYLGVGAGLAQVDLKVSATMYNCSPNSQNADPIYGMPIDLPNTDNTTDAYNKCNEGTLGKFQTATGETREVKTLLTTVPVDVYQKSGKFFIGGHVGGIFRFGDEPKNMGLQLNVNIMAMMPNQSLVVEPSLGFIYGL